MKTLLFVFLTMVALAVLTVTTSNVATADITGSDHDFSNKNWNSSGQLCQPCHTPHSANTTAGLLWNHEMSVASYTLYTTLSGQTGTPGRTSKLCLSCHDGTVAIDSFGGNTGTDFMSGGAKVGTDLSDDHPVGVTLPATSDFNTEAIVTGAGLPMDGSKVECGTCHDPHNGANLGKFMRIDNTASALCLTCHVK